MYELVNVKPVWDQGLTGAGVQIVMNDAGVDPDLNDLAVSEKKLTFLAEISLSNKMNESCELKLNTTSDIKTTKVAQAHTNEQPGTPRALIVPYVHALAYRQG